MIDYSSLIAFLRSDSYVDNTDGIASLMYHRYETLEHCSRIGSSTFLKTTACFLDKTVDTKEVFSKLKIGLMFSFRLVTRWKTIEM